MQPHYEMLTVEDLINNEKKLFSTTKCRIIGYLWVNEGRYFLSGISNSVNKISIDVDSIIPQKILPAISPQGVQVFVEIENNISPNYGTNESSLQNIDIRAKIIQYLPPNIFSKMYETARATHLLTNS